MRFRISLTVAHLFVTFLVLAAPQRRDEIACNNSPALCALPYDQITHLGAHDSPFVSDADNFYTPAGNQYYSSVDQLSAGVRLLTGQIHQDLFGDWHLCHTYCEIYDAGSLQDWLSGIKGWLDENPNDVVTLIFLNDGANATTLDGIFQASTITQYAYSPPSLTTPPAATGSSWPTLADLIAANTRLITFIQPLDPSQNTVAPYLLDEYTFVWENPYLYLNATSFSCQPDRPPQVSGKSPAAAFKTNRFAMLNHFRDTELLPGIEIPDTMDASMTNAPLGSVNSTEGSLGMAAQTCVAEWGRKPVFVLVDFYNLGPAIDTVDALNGVTDPVGRTGPGAVSVTVVPTSTPTPA